MSLVINNKASDYAEAKAIVCDKIDNAFTRYDGKSSNIVKRISVEIPALAILDWLRTQKYQEKFYWSNYNNSYETAGLGSADWVTNGSDERHTVLFKRISQYLEKSDNNIRYFGGFKFDISSPSDADWDKFGKAFFMLPRFAITREEEKYYFSINLVIDKDHKRKPSLLKEIHSLNFDCVETSDDKKEILSRIDYPSKDKWLDMIRSAKSSFDRDDYKKIVLARRSELKFSSGLSAEVILKKLKDRSRNCFHFLIQPKENLAFIGASPERLYRRSDRTLWCEAIAGTRERSLLEAEDTSLAKELLNSDKERYEHRFVIDSIIEGISSLTENRLTADDIEIRLLKLSRVQHLWGRLKFTLRNNVTDEDLINGLHPTAAVGGYPKEKVMSDIFSLEQFDRGWYAAPVGWIGKDSAEFAVAIRSGLVAGSNLYLYSGAGIIPDSQPDEEWKEIENKISNFLKVLS